MTAVDDAAGGPAPAVLPPATMECTVEGLDQLLVPNYVIEDAGGPESSDADLLVLDAAFQQTEPEPTPTTNDAAAEPRDNVAKTSFVPTPTAEPLAHLLDPVCAPAPTAVELTALFDGGRPMIGADYQRAIPLPGGRVLWLFQDAFLPTSHGPELVHNVGLLQSGQCFQLLRSGSTDSPSSYLFPELTDRYHRWFWPLGGGVGEDRHLHVFVAEMIERGDRYLTHTEPVATWLVAIDVDDLTVLDQQLAPNPSAELYGWSVVSAGEHTYLYSHCYRQFDTTRCGSHRTCSPTISTAPPTSSSVVSLAVSSRSRPCIGTGPSGSPIHAPPSP